MFFVHWEIVFIFSAELTRSGNIELFYLFIFFKTDFNFKWDSKNNWLVSASENIVGILNQIFCTLFRNSTVSRLSARIFYIQTGILAIWYVCKSSCLEKVFAMETASVRLTKELCTCNRDNWIVSSSLTGTQPVLCSHKCILYRA